MAFDGNGNFVRLHNWTSDAANGLDINASEMDGEDNGFAAGLSLAVTRDGQGKMTQDFLPVADNTLNLGNGSRRWASINGVPIGSILSGVYYAQTAAEAAAGAMPANFTFAPWRGEDVRRFGAVGDGVTDNTPFFNAAKSVGAALYVPPGTYLFATAITLAVPLFIDTGAILKAGAGIIPVLNCPISAGPWKIFDVSAAGSGFTSSGMSSSGVSSATSLRPMTYGSRIPVEWFGAVGDNVTDDTVALQNAANLAFDSNIIGCQLQAKIYHTTATVAANAHAGVGSGSFYTPSFFGTDPKKSQISLRGAALGTPALQLVGGSGITSHAVAQDIGFSGDSNSIGISFEGVCGPKAINCLFDTNFGGIRFYNNLAGSFTEFCRADFCEFTTNCTYPFTYNRAAGTQSFHGSGAYRCTVVTQTGTPAVVTVAANCFVYDAPLDLHIWTASGSTPTLVQNNSSTFPCTFHGDITVEIDGGGLTLAAGNPVYSACRIMTENNQVYGGTFVQCESIQINADQSVTALGVRKGYTQAVVTGLNTLPSAVGGQTRWMDVRILGTGYDWRGIFVVTGTGAALAGYQATILNALVTNTAAYGAPTFAVSTTGLLTLTNSLFPASGLTMTYAEKSFGAGQPGASALAQF